jgi:hypothetical protein
VKNVSSPAAAQQAQHPKRAEKHRRRLGNGIDLDEIDFEPIDCRFSRFFALESLDFMDVFDHPGWGCRIRVVGGRQTGFFSFHPGDDEDSGCRSSIP